MNAEYRVLRLSAPPKQLVDEVNAEQNKNQTREHVGDHPKELVSNVRLKEDGHLRRPEPCLIFEISILSRIRAEDKKVRSCNNELKN